MKKATKATINRLKKAAENTHCDSPANIILRMVLHAEENAQIYDDCLQYDAMDEYNEHHASRERYGFYSTGGICYKPQLHALFNDEQQFFIGLSVKGIDGYDYKFTHDLNTVTIKDINKFVKEVII